jgi:hypothetical protein
MSAAEDSGLSLNLEVGHGGKKGVGQKVCSHAEGQ